jgi:hypothetical protein
MNETRRNTEGGEGEGKCNGTHSVCRNNNISHTHSIVSKSSTVWFWRFSTCALVVSASQSTTPRHPHTRTGQGVSMDGHASTARRNEGRGQQRQQEDTGAPSCSAGHVPNRARRSCSQSFSTVEGSPTVGLYRATGDNGMGRKGQVFHLQGQKKTPHASIRMQDGSNTARAHPTHEQAVSPLA